MEQHEIKLSKAKCSFIQPSVDCLGHQVDAEGLHTTADKVEALLKAPVPTNMQELRSFLDLLKYYGKFLPNFAATHYSNTTTNKGGPKLVIVHSSMLRRYLSILKYTMTLPVP